MGDSFGVDFALVHTDEPVVEYYDARYPHTQYGQFVTRYHLSTLIGRIDEPHDLGLYGGEKNWVLDAESLKKSVRWAEEYIASRQS